MSYKQENIKDGQTLGNSLSERDFAKAVVVNKFTSEDISNMVNTLDTTQQNTQLIKQNIQKKEGNNYIAEFDMQYNFPTESSALLFKTINHELTNSGKTNQEMDVLHSGKEVVISVKSKNNDPFLSTLQNSEDSFTVRNVLKKEHLLLTSELFTSTMSNLLNSNLYDFFDNNKKHETIARMVTDGQSFNEVAMKVSEQNSDAYHKGCISANCVEMEQSLNNQIIDSMRKVEGKLVQRKKEHLPSDVVLAGNNFEISNKIEDLQLLQRDICNIAHPQLKIDDLAMKNIRSLIKKQHILISPEEQKEETQGIFNEVSQSIKAGISKVIEITIGENLELVDKNDVQSKNIDPTRHKNKNKYV